ncbi:MAG: DUF4412 domain-containing protein [Opitutaceae bacterium]|nr:DUF4412 domain-containing protein [Opitutaceae bacterium]
MKKLLVCLVAAAVGPAAFAATPFEGKVTFKMTAPRGAPQEMRYAIKGDKVRIEMPGQQEMGGMIMDTSKREMLVLMDAQRMYMVMPMGEVTNAVAEKSGPEATLEKTGETEKILGYTAEKYISTYQGSKTELWLAEGLGSFTGMAKNPMGGGRGGSAPKAWERSLAGKPLFPLRVVDRDKSGKESFRMEATSIDKQALPDGMFTPPADYQKMDMGGMMMPGMMRGMPKR